MVRVRALIVPLANQDFMKQLSVMELVTGDVHSVQQVITPHCLTKPRAQFAKTNHGVFLVPIAVRRV